MTFRRSGSMASELAEGATDGKYKKVRPNTTVADWEGHEQTLANKASLTVPGTEATAAWGPLPLTSEYRSKVRPA